MSSDKKKNTNKHKSTQKEAQPNKHSNNSKNVSQVFSDAVGTRRPVEFVPPASRFIEEPHCLCAVCGTPIESISEAISWREEGKYVHFDCMLDVLKDEYHPAEDEKISYIGRGTFAVVRIKPEGGFEIVERIEVENQKTLDDFRAYVEGIKK